MSEHVKLPEGVERFSLVTSRDRHREEMRPDACGSYLCVSEMLAERDPILDQRDAQDEAHWLPGALPG